MKMHTPVIVEIIKFLPTGHFFQKHIFLCKRIARDVHLKRYMCKRHLGIIEDKEQEQSYHPQASLSQYESVDRLGLYLNTYTRKSAYKLMLFGCQAIGGVEKSAQVIPDFEMTKRGITHLFIDSAGTYNSGQEQCVLTGAFFHEVDRENATGQEMLQELTRIVNFSGGQHKWADCLDKIEKKAKIDLAFRDLY